MNAPVRYSVYMALALALFLAGSSIKGSLTPELIWSVGVALITGLLAALLAPSEGPVKHSWFGELLSSSTVILLVLSLFYDLPPFFYYAVMLAGSSIFLLALRPRFLRRPDMATVGLVTGITSFVVVYLLASLVTMLTGLELAFTTFKMQMLAPLMFLVVAIPEELWARAFLYSSVKQFVGSRTAAFWSAFWFVAAHLPTRTEELSGTYLLAVTVILASATLIFTYIYMREIEHPMVTVLAHTTYNTIIGAIGSPIDLVFGIAVIALIWFAFRSYAREVVQ